MFDLEKEIQNWKKDLQKHEGIEPGYIEELESHLRDKIEDLVLQGLGEEEAFQLAVEDHFDNPEEIAEQFFQARKTKLAPPPWEKRSWLPVLLPNFIKVALRNFRRNKGYSVINISGLALGIASCLMIMMYVQHELSYDQFHEKADRIYRVNQSNIWGDRSEKFSSTGPGVAGALIAELPEIETVVRIHTPPDFIVTIEGTGGNPTRSFEEKKSLAVDSTFFDVFSFALKEGNPETALDKPNSVVLTQKTSRKYFGNVSSIGKELTIKSGDLKKSFTVTGIVSDPPNNSHFDFSMLTSMSSFPRVKESEWSWIWTTFVTYALIEENAPVGQLKAKLPSVVEKHAAATVERIFGLQFEEYINQEGPWNLYFQPLTDIWLYSEEAGNRLGLNGDITYVYIFSAVALLIIILACINFMNLSTAKSIKRAKEVGVRKTLGSGKFQLIVQFLGESILYSLLATCIGLFITWLVLPDFNELAGKQLEFGYLFSPIFILGIPVFIIITGLIAGIYPAFFLTSFNPVSALKGQVQSHLKRKSITLSSLRNGLVVIQFSISICLIISSIIIFNQMEFIQTKDLGFKKDRLLVLHNAELLQVDEETFSQVLKKQPGITKVGYSNGTPPRIWYEDYYKPYGSSAPAVPVNGLLADEEFLPALEVKFLKGRNFSKERPADVNGVILNEAAVNQLHWNVEDPNPDFPLGELIQYGDSRFRVIGVINDFNYRSLYSTVPPLAVFHKDSDHWFGPKAFFIARLGDEAHISETVGSIQRYWRNNFPEAPFEYSFVSDDLNQQYATDKSAGSIFGAFTFLAIFIACLGLLGLIAFVAEQRTKEVGIRKVMGASAFNIVWLLSSDFTKLIGIAFLIASPAAWFLMQDWLRDFEYHISVEPVTFIAGGIIALVIALLTISIQTVKAALANPVKSLRSE